MTLLVLVRAVNPHVEWTNRSVSLCCNVLPCNIQAWSFTSAVALAATIVCHLCQLASFDILFSNGLLQQCLFKGTIFCAFHILNYARTILQRIFAVSV